MAEVGALAFILHVSKLLNAFPSTKYCALSLFTRRFLPWLSSKKNDGLPLKLQVRRLLSRKSLQFASLVFIWIASKIHETRPFAVQTLKDVANDLIPDVHISALDFAEAELVFMKAIGFELGTGLLISDAVGDLLHKFKSTALVGRLMSMNTALSIIDLLYGTEGFNLAVVPPELAASAILAVTYIISVPKENCNFPVLPWLTGVSGASEQEIKRLTREIIKIILN